MGHGQHGFVMEIQQGIVDRGADAYDKLEEKGRSVLCKDPEVGFGLLFCSHLNSTMQLIVDRELSKKNDLMLAACSESAVANTCPGICKRQRRSSLMGWMTRQLSGVCVGDCLGN